MWAIKGDAEAMFFLLFFCLYYLPLDPGFFCFEVGRGCWSFCSVLSSTFFPSRCTFILESILKSVFVFHIIQNLINAFLYLFLSLTLLPI